jgi:hypothetical protein
MARGRRDLEISIPPFFTCPISLELMNDPVSTCTGVTYDRASIEKWIDDGNNTCPATLLPLVTKELIPNHTLRRLIQAWCGANSAKGVERIPTPKTPANPHTVRWLFQEIESAGTTRIEALQRLKRLARDSVRNAICISDEGGPAVLAGVLRENRDEEGPVACEEAVGVLAVLPLDEATKRKVGGAAELETMAGLLRSRNVEARIGSAEVIERLTTDERVLWQISAVDGLIEGLVDMLRSPPAVRAGLKALLAVCSVAKNRAEAIEAGAVERLVDILMERDAGVDEPCLCLLESLCRCAEGRAAVAGHALAVPVIVKKMSRSSPLATEYALGALWSVCGHCRSENVHRYAAESGVCSKLFWLLQVDCTPKAKLKASELIRLIHSTCRDCPCCYTNSFLQNAALLEDD